jgi:hypothetical protein
MALYCSQRRSPLKCPNLRRQRDWRSYASCGFNLSTACVLVRLREHQCSGRLRWRFEVITGRDPFVIRWRCLPLLYVPRRALYVVETTFSSKFESHSLRHSFNHNHLVRGVATTGGYQYLWFFSDPRYWLGLQRKKWGCFRYSTKTYRYRSFQPDWPISISCPSSNRRNGGDLGRIFDKHADRLPTVHFGCWGIANSKLMQFRVLGLGLLQDGDLRVGVLPEGQEILIGNACFGGFALQGESTSDF